MKTLFFTVCMVLVAAGCKSEVAREKIVVTTPIGRKVAVTRRYTMKEIEVGILTPVSASSAFEIRHPVYPNREEFEVLKTYLKPGGDIWYFQGMDSGWAIIKDHEVVWVLVTNHEY